jgi:hypothetical protein
MMIDKPRQLDQVYKFLVIGNKALLFFICF